MSNNMILVAGAGGFIGGHLVKHLLDKGETNIRAVDIKPFDEWYQHFPEVESFQADLKDFENCRGACEDVREVYNLAADMGGMGFISCNHSKILYTNALINFHTLDAARVNGVKRYLYTSSACIYPEYKQVDANVTPLKEEDAYPAQPQDAYGWEKLVTERLCIHYREDHGIETRIVRFHNIFGPLGTWTGGREKAPAAICRKVAEAENGGAIEVWGDGTAVRSYIYVDDLVDGIVRLMRSDLDVPANIGTPEYVSVRELVETVIAVSGNLSSARRECFPRRRHVRNPRSEPGTSARPCVPPPKAADGSVTTGSAPAPSGPVPDSRGRPPAVRSARRRGGARR